MNYTTFKQALNEMHISVPSKLAKRMYKVYGIKQKSPTSLFLTTVSHGGAFQLMFAWVVKEDRGNGDTAKRLQKMETVSHGFTVDGRSKAMMHLVERLGYQRASYNVFEAEHLAATNSAGQLFVLGGADGYYYKDPQSVLNHTHPVRVHNPLSDKEIK